MREPARGFSPRRRFGQNFLVNEGAIDSLIAAFRPGPADRVLEIGPGRGALTRRLLGQVGQLTAIEVDRALVAFRRQSFPVRAATPAALRLIEADVLQLNLGTILEEMGATPAEPARVIANLPYNIATAVILMLLPERPLLRDLLVMVQREVAERIMARPGTRSYGGLGGLTQAAGRAGSNPPLRPRPVPPPPEGPPEADLPRPPPP